MLDKVPKLGVDGAPLLPPFENNNVILLLDVTPVSEISTSAGTDESFTYAQTPTPDPRYVFELTALQFAPTQSTVRLPLTLSGPDNVPLKLTNAGLPLAL